jgi:copper chaperone
MVTTTIAVSGMTCMGCVASVKRVLGGLDGVSNAEVTLSPAQAIVTYEAGKIDPQTIKTAISDAGYDVA